MKTKKDILFAIFGVFFVLGDNNLHAFCVSVFNVTFLFGYNMDGLCWNIFDLGDDPEAYYRKLEQKEEEQKKEDIEYQQGLAERTEARRKEEENE